MKKLSLFVFLTLVSTAAHAAATDVHPRPFFKEPVGSIREAAKACENEDKSVMNVTCDEMRETVNKAFEKMKVDVRFSTKESYIDYMGTLVAKPCGHPRSGDKVPFARKMPDGSIDLDGFTREIRDGEMCGFDPTNAVFPFSLVCGNPIPEVLNVFTAMGSNGSRNDANADSQGVGKAEIDAAAKRAAQAEKDADAAREEERRLKKAREDWEKSQQRAKKESLSSSTSDGHWYSSTPAKVGIGAGIAGAVTCALVPGHCGLFTQRQLVCINSDCTGK